MIQTIVAIICEIILQLIIIEKLAGKKKKFVNKAEKFLMEEFPVSDKDRHEYTGR